MHIDSSKSYKSIINNFIAYTYNEYTYSIYITCINCRYLKKYIHINKDKYVPHYVYLY